MRFSIIRVALALLTVAAITGCQSGTVWDRLVLDPFHAPSNTLPPGVYYYDAAMAPTPPSLCANSPGSRYGSTTASPSSIGVTDGNDVSRKQ